MQGKAQLPEKGDQFFKTPVLRRPAVLVRCQEARFGRRKKGLSALRRFFRSSSGSGRRSSPFSQNKQTHKNGFGFAMEQLIEPTNPILIQTDNLAIEDGVLYGQFG